MLIPEQNIGQWLSAGRPLLWQLLAEKQQAFSDDNAIDILLNLLHSPEGLPSKAYNAYRTINQHLMAYPQLLWPMLIRAEGWLRSRSALRSEWGGKRQRAGRSPMSSRTQTA